MPTSLVPVVAGMLDQTKPMSHPPPTMWNQLGRERQMRLAQRWAKLVRQIQHQKVATEEKDGKG
jgi:hypothetical protein